MASKNKQPGAGGETNEMMIIVAVMLIFFLLWWAFKSKIAAIVLGVRLGESFFINLITNDLSDLRMWMKGIDRRSVTAGDLFTVSQKVGWYVRFLTTPVLLYLGYKLYKSSPTERFRRRFTDKTLPLAQADIYPWMKISTKIDFPSMDPEVGPWAFAKTERMFAREYKLRTDKGEIDKDRAEQIFIKQLGSIWLGYKNLKPHAKAMFAMLSARVNKDFKTSDKFLLQLAESAANGKLDYTGIDELAAKYLDSKPVKRLIRQHAYEKTILMSLLERGRGGDSGKDYLPPNWFLWLKGVDRGLWYALSDVGRKAPHVESGGVYAHWLTEKTRNKRLEMPFVENAVTGLVNELAKFTEDGDQGMSDDDDLLDLHLSDVLVIPTPEEAEMSRQKRVVAGGAGGGKRIETLDDDSSY
jgi:intracellular multiplication protein IcmP